MFAAGHVSESKSERRPRVLAVDCYRRTGLLKGARQHPGKPGRTPALMHMPEAEPRVQSERTGIGRIQSQCRCQQIEGGLMTALGMQPHMREGANDTIPCVEPTWWLLLNPLALGPVNLRFDCHHNASRDFVLDREHIDQRPFVAR